MKLSIRICLLSAVVICSYSASLSSGRAVGCEQFETQPNTRASIENQDKTKTETEDSKATVYVYRHKEVGSRNMQPSVLVDGSDVARMDDGKFFIVKIDPGKHVVSINKGHSGAEIDMKAGEDYYFRVSMKAGVWVSHGQIDFVQKEQGMFEIKKMQPLEAKWIKDKARVSVEDNKNRR